MGAKEWDKIKKFRDQWVAMWKDKVSVTVTPLKKRMHRLQKYAKNHMFFKFQMKKIKRIYYEA